MIIATLRNRLLLGGALALTMLAIPLTAGATATAYGERDDAEIRELVDMRRADLDAVPEEQRTGVIYLDRSLLILADGNRHRKIYNRLMHVYDLSDEEAATRTFEFHGSLEVKQVSAFVLGTDGSVRRLGESDIQITRDDDEAPTTVVLGFPQLEPGDALGWSIRVDADHILYVENFMVDAEEYVHYGVIQVRSGKGTAYSIAAENVDRDRFEIDLSHKEDGAYTRMTCTYSGISPYRSDWWSPPWRFARSHVRVMHKGWLHEDSGVWIINRSWNSVAVQVESLMEDFRDPDKRVRRVAEQLTEGVNDPDEKMLALYRYVRDELMDLEEYETFEFRSPRKVLESRSATPMEKGMVLFALARATGLEAQCWWMRDRLAGDLDHRNPGYWQFTDVVVSLGIFNDGSPRWYCPGERDFAPGLLPPRLRRVEALRFLEGIDDRRDRMVRDVYARFGGNRQKYVLAYIEALADAGWVYTLETGGDPHEVVGRAHELRRVDLASGASSFHVEAQGIAREASQIRNGEFAEEAARGYLKLKGWDSADIADATAMLGADGVEAELDWSTQEEVPPPMGDVWILPAEFLLGRRTFSFWEGPDRGPMYISSSRTRVTRSEFVVPEGWTVVELPPSEALRNPLFRYSASFVVEDQTLVFERTLDIKAGAVKAETMGLLDTDIRQMHAFETQALVLRREGTVEDSSR